MTEVQDRLEQLWEEALDMGMTEMEALVWVYDKFQEQEDKHMGNAILASIGLAVALFYIMEYLP